MRSLSGLDYTDDMYILSTIDVHNSEHIAMQVAAAFPSECGEAVLPFICLYLFPLCDGNQTLHLPSIDECNAISMGICSTEWKIAQKLDARIADCKILLSNGKRYILNSII